MGREITILYHTIKKVVIDGKEVDAFNTTTAVFRDEKQELRTKGCVNFEIINTGSVTCNLYGNIPLLSGQSYHPAKYDLLPIAENVKFAFVNDYSNSRMAQDNPFPAPGTVVKG